MVLSKAEDKILCVGNSIASRARSEKEVNEPLKLNLLRRDQCRY